MKKIIACISLVFAMSAGVTALAAVDNVSSKEADNTVTVKPATTFNTVLITADDKNDEIVYVNQNDAGYTVGTATDFLLKSSASYGTYTMKRGVTGGDALEEVNFEIVEDVPVITDLKITNEQLNEDGSRNIGCFASGLPAEKCKSVVLTSSLKEGDGTTKVLCLGFDTEFSGPGDVNVAIKITNVPAKYNLTIGVSDKAPAAE